MSSGGVPIAVRHIEVITVLLMLATLVDCTFTLYRVVVLPSTLYSFQSVKHAKGSATF
jgi:hypothetical protein